VSCNTAFAQMAVELGPAAMAEGAAAFGFNERPPLDLPAPAASRFHEAGFFDRNTPLLAQAGIGQHEVQSSPHQLALVAAAVANDGAIMAPHLMKEIRDDQGELVRRFEPRPWRQAISAEAAAVLRETMVETVARGTGTRMAIPGVTAAGKTGTAELGTEPPGSHAWMIGFAPVPEPRVAVAVIVEGAPGVGEQTGGRVAAPIARAVLEAALAATGGADPTTGQPGR
jgi:peptidoglycan glycosyltransferase